MNEKKVGLFIIFSFVLCLSFFKIFSTSNKYIVNAANEKEKNFKLVNEEYSIEEDYEIKFDFGDNIITSNSEIYCELYDDFEGISSLTYTGNIVIDVLYSDINIKKLKIIIPDFDTETLITLSCGEITKSIMLYSTKNNDEYGISTISLYNAWGLVGNIPGQNFMDNDTIEAIYQDENENTFHESGNMNDRSSGGVYGYLNWTDDDNRVHPLIGAKVKLSFVGIQAVYTFTDSNGFFQLYFSNMIGNPTIHIYAENIMVAVKYKDDYNVEHIYEKSEYLSNFNNSYYNYGTYTFNNTQDSDLARAMQIFSAMYNYSNYAKSLNDGDNIHMCFVEYPNSSEDIAYYNGQNNTIYLPTEDYSVFGAPSVHGSWDVIGHEYGHHLQNHFFYQSFGGRHSAFGSDIERYIISNLVNNTPTFDDLYAAKKNGCKLAFGEAWPTFFAISAQSTFSNDIKTVPTVGNSVYEPYNFSQEIFIDLFDLQYKRGEACECVNMSVLYHIWQSGISDEDLWYLMCEYNPENLSDFISVFYEDSYFDIDLDYLGYILEYSGLSADYLDDTYNSSNYAIPASYSWIGNGYSFSYNGYDYAFNNNEFRLMFYDSNYNFIFEGGYTGNTSYTLTESEWNQILSLSSSTYYIRIKSYATLGYRTGPYISHYFQCTRPYHIWANYDINISNSRYYEKSMYIRSGTTWKFYITFDTSGNKLLQTFGNSDTLMQLYYLNQNNLIYSNDNSGYGNNSLIYANLLSNTTYILKISINNNVGGFSKLSIISTDGEIDTTNGVEFEDIYNLNFNNSLYIYNSSVEQYKSTIITWTPSQSGYYYVTLESSFDNFLYVIDPTSASDLIEDIDYNDDEYYYDEEDYDLNALLHNYYDSNKTYLIVFNQVNPSHSLNQNENSISIIFDAD